MTRKILIAGLGLVVMLGGCANDTPPVAPGELDPSQSTIVVDRSAGVLANGTDAVRVTVTARDKDGQPVAGAAVIVTAEGDAVTLSDSPSTDASGVSHATLTSTRAQTVTLSATLGGAPLAQKPKVEFVAGAAKELVFTVFPGAAEAGALIDPARRRALLPSSLP